MIIPKWSSAAIPVIDAADTGGLPVSVLALAIVLSLLLRRLRRRCTAVSPVQRRLP